MAPEFRVFLSAVTSEFGTARDALANDLQARGLQLRVRRSFRQEPGVLTPCCGCCTTTSASAAPSFA